MNQSKKRLSLGGLFLMATIPFWAPLFAGDEDPYLWLEDVTGEKALTWVKEQNAASLPILENVKGFKEAKQSILSVLDSKERIPYASTHGKYLYNFWRDAEHVRGIYRRTTLQEYQKSEPKWETVLDFDELAKEEGKNWLYKGANFLYPDTERCLINLSRGGADATEVREFDLKTKSFVKDGFRLPEAKSSLAWRDKDHLYVGTDFGSGSLTESGYPRIVKLWTRGTSLDEAVTLFEVDPEHVYAYGARMERKGAHYDILVDATSFYSKEVFILKGDKKIRLDIPIDAELEDFIYGQFIIQLKSDWLVNGKTFTQGSLIMQDAEDIIVGKKNYTVLFKPEPGISLASVSTTENMILLNLLDKVTSRLAAFKWDGKANWKPIEIKTESNGKISIFDTKEDSDDFFYNFESYLTPSSLFQHSGETGKSKLLKSLPAFFDSKPYRVEQFQAVSKDGTAIPYFILHRKDWTLDGNNPTLLYGYGGFEISMTPRYSATTGNAWLNKGGVYVVSNIRGGGEFGPHWHQSALLKNKHKSYEDFIAIAEDLIKRKVTSKAKLAIQGGSNGGLLVGAVTMMRPDLFKAVICQVPLLDMKRYTKLLAGASWAAEYGEPDDPDMWQYIKTYSPYHNVKKDVKYPKIFFTTSTRDDRVHPGHARKMVAKMKAMGNQVLYFENMEGGHAGASNNEQRANMIALTYAYLYMELIN